MAAALEAPSEPYPISQIAIVVHDAARMLLGRDLRIDLELGDTGAVGTNGVSGPGTARELEAGAREELQRHHTENRNDVLPGEEYRDVSWDAPVRVFQMHFNE